MSDETSSLLGIASTGWGVAIIAATWGIVLRTILARRDAKERKIEERLDNLEKAVSAIQVSLATIAGRMLERDVRGNYTWPGDKR
jgi:tetrahydromethanopterin S-methyltransferase subunit G